jgi:hypothetical protein
MTSDWQRHLPPLVLFSSLGFLIGLILVIPGDEWPSLLVYLPLLGGMALVLYLRGIKSIDPYFPGALFILALMLKLISSLVRYWTVVDVYDFAADSPYYHYEGQYIAQFFQQLDFSVLDYYQFRGEGTTQMVFLTAAFYTVLPPSLPGSFFLFAGLAFGGSVLFYRSFRIAFPQVEPNLYRLIVFFLPSILFWPSSLGKEAWLFFCSGLVAYGLVNFVRRGGVPWLGVAIVGLLLVNLIRPHFAAFMVLGMGGAYFLSLQDMVKGPRFVSWLLGAGIVVGIGGFAFSSGSASLGLDELSVETLEANYESVQANTEQGGSKFTPVSIFTPWGLIYGIITVIFRPFPWEAASAQVMISALEASLWLVLFWTRRRVFLSRMRSVAKDPWIAFLVIYSLVMILAFTTFANFGILARQRVLLLPFFWMLVI